MKAITACTMDCPDACSLVVSSDDRGVWIRGNPDHPVTAGVTCAKIKKLIRRLQHPERILRPMIRKGERFRTIGWDEALDICAEKIQMHRKEPASILHIFGSGAKGVLKEGTALFFTELGASRTRGSLCDAAGILASVRDFGSRFNPDLKDLVNAKRIVNWGKDLSRSSIHTAAAVGKARRQGTAVLTLSPGGDGNRAFSDRHIRIRPGTDRFLAAAVIRRLFEEVPNTDALFQYAEHGETFRRLILDQSEDDLLAACGVTRGDADQVFAWYADPAPTATLIGAGLQRYRFGGENIRFIDALVFLSGNVGRPGGGCHFHLSSYRNLNLSWLAGKRRRSFRLPTIGREILSATDPPVRMIWISSINIVNQAADSRRTALALQGTDFCVVVDAFMTDTAQRAHLVLPSTLMLEQEDIVASYLHDYVQYVRAAVKPPGEARDDYSILSELGRRLSPPIRLPEKEACFKAALDAPVLDISLDSLRELNWVKARRPEIPYTDLRFDHPDGKYRFPIQLHSEPAPKTEYPLRLLSLLRGDAMHSQILPEDQSGTPRVWMAPENPTWSRIDPEKDVYLVSPRGKLKVVPEILDGLQPEAVLYRRGDWMRLGGGVNQLIEARLTDMGTGAAYYDQYVRLENGR